MAKAEVEREKKVHEEAIANAEEVTERLAEMPPPWIGLDRGGHGLHRDDPRAQRFVAMASAAAARKRIKMQRAQGLPPPPPPSHPPPPLSVQPLPPMADLDWPASWPMFMPVVDPTRLALAKERVVVAGKPTGRREARKGHVPLEVEVEVTRTCMTCATLMAPPPSEPVMKPRPFIEILRDVKYKVIRIGIQLGATDKETVDAACVQLLGPDDPGKVQERSLYWKVTQLAAQLGVSTEARAR